MFEQEGIVRTDGVKINARGAGWKCREMTVGVQRLTLVTPAENVEGELAANNEPAGTDDKVGDVEGVGETEVVTGDDVETSDDKGHVTSREIKNLEVPSWMRPASASRSCCFSIVNHSTLQGLNMGLWIK